MINALIEINALCVPGKGLAGWEAEGEGRHSRGRAGAGAAPGLGSQWESAPRAFPVPSAPPDHPAHRGNIHFLTHSLMISGKSLTLWAVAVSKPFLRTCTKPHSCCYRNRFPFPSSLESSQTSLILLGAAQELGVFLPLVPGILESSQTSLILLGAAQGLCGFRGEPDVAAQQILQMFHPV